MDNSRQNLIRILQSAYSGELAAAYAYRGHWKSLKDSTDKERIKQIERDEWIHRKQVGYWLEKLNAPPRKFREIIFWIIGKSIGVSCYISGWFLPMYFAGRLESNNVKEYEDAAEFAKSLEMQACFEEMMEMAKVEQEHEDFFKQVVSHHRLLPVTKRFFHWG